MWAIWAEGYAATGEHSGAICLGSAEGVTFNEAVHRLSTSVKMREEAHFFRFNETTGQWTFWLCRLYPTESEARVSFG